MAREENVYIQNLTDHGIKVRSADEKLVKRFSAVQFDDLTGRPTHTGYTPLTRTEYDTLRKESKLFSSCLERNLLALHTDLPEDVMTPHDALVRAKREAAESAQLLVESEKESAALTARLAALEARNKELSDTVAALEAEQAALAAKGKKG
jgi:hypothetical protein